MRRLDFSPNPASRTRGRVKSCIASENPRSKPAITLSPQEIDPIGPVPIDGLPCQLRQSPDQPAYIRLGYCLFVYKNYATVLAAFFCPGFEQGRNRPSII